MEQVSGHVRLVKRKRVDQWYVKYRDGDSSQVQKRLGPAWTARSRPPAGYYTRKSAEEALQATLTDLRRGTLVRAKAGDATFADAAAEYLRYVGQVRQIDVKTLSDYRGVVEGYLLAEFAETPVGAVTPEWSTPTRRG